MGSDQSGPTPLKLVAGGGEEAPGELSRFAEQAREGSGEAADHLWTLVRPRLTRVALALGVATQDVPDLVQDTLLAAHRALFSFDSQRGSFEGWVMTILTRRARNFFRGRSRRVRFLGVLRRLHTGRSEESRATEVAEARLTIARLLTCLTETQRQVVALYEIGELSSDEAGAVLGMTPAGIRSIARDARQRLSEAAGRISDSKEGPR